MLFVHNPAASSYEVSKSSSTNRILILDLNLYFGSEEPKLPDLHSSVIGPGTVKTMVGLVLQSLFFFFSFFGMP